MKLPLNQIIAAGVLASVGLAAIAQPSPFPGSGSAAPQTQYRADRQPGANEASGMHEGRGPREGMKEEFRARRLARLKETLRITPAQEPAWAAYTNALRPTRRQRPDLGEMARLTTPERIDRMRALRTERMAEMDRRGEATKALYAALSAEQKRVLDQITLRGGARDEAHGRPGHHG